MRFGTWGAISGFLAVLAGAFGAHALRTRITPELMQAFETGTRYQLIHALALVIVDRASHGSTRGAWRVAGYAFLAGTVLFSGSLELLALTGVRALGAITPLGGVCFLLGWLALARALRADA